MWTKEGVLELIHQRLSDSASEKARNEETTTRYPARVFRLRPSEPARTSTPILIDLDHCLCAAARAQHFTLKYLRSSQAAFVSGYKASLEFPVPGNRRGAVCRGIEVDVVPATRALQNARAALQFADEFSALQAGTSMSFVWMAADVGEICSSSISR